MTPGEVGQFRFCPSCARPAAKRPTWDQPADPAVLKDFEPKTEEWVCTGCDRPWIACCCESAARFDELSRVFQDNERGGSVAASDDYYWHGVGDFVEFCKAAHLLVPARINAETESTPDPPPGLYHPALHAAVPPGAVGYDIMTRTGEVLQRVRKVDGGLWACEPWPEGETARKCLICTVC